MDIIEIKDLEVCFRVGVPDQERAHPQRLLITVELMLDFTNAAKTDDLNQTLNYFSMTQQLLSFGRDREWKLIEKLAADIADQLLHDYKPLQIRVQIKKFIIPEAQYVSVTTTRRAG